MEGNRALIERCQRGDQRAWNALVEQFQRLVYSIPLNVGLSHDDAADVTQATFATLAGSINSINEPERLSAWISTVAKRHTIRVLEQRDRDRQRDGRAAAEPIEATLIDSVADDVEWVHQGLALINPKCRELLTRLYFSDGATYEAAAADMGMPLGSLGPTRRRCIESLRQALLTLDVIGADGRA